MGSPGPHDPGGRRPDSRGHGHRQRHARQLLRRRPLTLGRGRGRTRPRPGPAGGRPARPGRRVEPAGLGAGAPRGRAAPAVAGRRGIWDRRSPCRSRSTRPRPRSPGLPWPRRLDHQRHHRATRRPRHGPRRRRPGAGVVLMHMQALPGPCRTTRATTMSSARSTTSSPARRLGRVARHPASRIAIDPGIGFGKTFEHNLEILRNLDRFANLGCAVLVGTSRKGFLGTITGRACPSGRWPRPSRRWRPAWAVPGSCGSTTWRRWWTRSRSGRDLGLGG